MGITIQKSVDMMVGIVPNSTIFCNVILIILIGLEMGTATLYITLQPVGMMEGIVLKSVRNILQKQLMNRLPNHLVPQH